jgi:predicted RNase H-like nuclease (RuvC/YqgF family)
MKNLLKKFYTNKPIKVSFDENEINDLYIKYREKIRIERQLEEENYYLKAELENKKYIISQMYDEIERLKRSYNNEN